MRSGFTRVDNDVRDLPGEMGELRVELRDGLAAVREEVATIREDIDSHKSNLLHARYAPVITLIRVLAAVLTRI
jgi:hypothetical protein